MKEANSLHQNKGEGDAHEFSKKEKKQMNTKNENNTMNTTKKTCKPIRIRMYSEEFGFDQPFEIDFKVERRSAVRELVKYLIGFGYVAMTYCEYLDCVFVSKNSKMIDASGYVPLTAVGLTRMMGYAA